MKSTACDCSTWSALRFLGRLGPRRGASPVLGASTVAVALEEDLAAALAANLGAGRAHPWALTQTQHEMTVQVEVQQTHNQNPHCTGA